MLSTTNYIYGAARKVPWHYLTEVCSELCQTYKMESFAKIVNRLKPLK